MLERGERPKAKYNYEKILGKALLGHGRAEHWAHSEYAWIAFEDGDLEVRTAPTLQLRRLCHLPRWQRSTFRRQSVHFCLKSRGIVVRLHSPVLFDTAWPAVLTIFG
jgi:hypothetical protein